MPTPSQPHDQTTIIPSHHESLKRMAIRLKREYQEGMHQESWTIKVVDDRYASEGILPGNEAEGTSVYILWDAQVQELTCGTSKRLP